VAACCLRSCFSRQDIINNLDAVAEILAAAGHPQIRLIVVGGSYLAMHGLRDATRDIDTITALDERSSRNACPSPGRLRWESLIVAKA
jgi:Nucleotidyltransferase of unknown function (DUF6036)